MQGKKKMIHAARPYKRRTQSYNPHAKKQKKCKQTHKHFLQRRRKTMKERLKCASSENEKNICENRSNTHETTKTCVADYYPKTARKLHVKSYAPSKKRQKLSMANNESKSRIEDTKLTIHSLKRQGSLRAKIRKEDTKLTIPPKRRPKLYSMKLKPESRIEGKPPTDNPPEER